METLARQLHFVTKNAHKQGGAQDLGTKFLLPLYRDLEPRTKINYMDPMRIRIEIWNRPIAFSMFIQSANEKHIWRHFCRGFDLPL